MFVNKKDLIRINQEIGEEGIFINESSLDFALDVAKQKKAWLYELSYIIRSLLTDHAFKNGNKRTSLILVALYLEEKSFFYDNQLLVKAIQRITVKCVKNPKMIAGLIKNVIR